MKRQLRFLLICFSLIIPGSGFLNDLNAQIRGGRNVPSTARKDGKQ